MDVTHTGETLGVIEKSGAECLPSDLVQVTSKRTDWVRLVTPLGDSRSGKEKDHLYHLWCRIRDCPQDRLPGGPSSVVVTEPGDKEVVAVLHEPTVVRRKLY